VLEEHRRTAHILRRMVAELFPVGQPVRLPRMYGRAGGGRPAAAVGVVGGHPANAPDVVRVLVERPAASGAGSVQYPVDVLVGDLLDENPE
jgi:hypothetical protein